MYVVAQIGAVAFLGAPNLMFPHCALSLQLRPKSSLCEQNKCGGFSAISLQCLYFCISVVDLKSSTLFKPFM